MQPRGPSALTNAAPPNNRLNPPVGTVTGHAGGRPAPAPPAGYAARQQALETKEMNLQRPILALTIAGVVVVGSFPARAEPASSADLATTEYEHVFSVGCAPPDGRRVAYVWHTSAVPEPEGERIFKELAAPDFEECLSEIARTKDGLYEVLLNLGPRSGQEVTREIMEQATTAWSQFGVYRVVEEVAKTGARGEKVNALLAACDHLRRTREEAEAAR